jgi:transposase-like protein
MIIDAIVFSFRENRRYQKYTIYLTAVRSVSDHCALLLEPFVMPGKESLSGWQATVRAIPENVRIRIIAFVSDGFSGVAGFAQQHGWLLQRCHFHLISQLQQFRGKYKHRIPHVALREEIYRTCRAAIEETDKLKLKTTITYLKELTADRHCPKWIRLRGNELLRRLGYFRTYLDHPELELPTTTNTIESFNRTIRELANRSRGFRTIGSLRLWLSALVATQPLRVCNPKKISTK